MKKREFIKLSVAGAGAMILRSSWDKMNAQMKSPGKVAEVGSGVIRLDSSRISNAVPAVRGAMTEWMYLGPDVDRTKLKPRGPKGGYGVLFDLEEEDFALAAQTGINTIRCAVEHTSLEDHNQPGKYFEHGFARIAKMLDMCAKYDLQVIIDLHNALGREGGGDPRLWQEKAYQDRFVNVWQQLAKRFKDSPQVIAFEPLNEAEPRFSSNKDECSAVWNNLTRRVTDAIRKIDTTKPIIIDSIEYADPEAFKWLVPTGDPNTVYSFHWYGPGDFHRQRGTTSDNPYRHYPERYEGKWWNRQVIGESFQPAFDFGKKHNVPIFCGEFGCVSNCPEMEDIVWLLDIISLLDQNNAGWTYYHYMFRTIEPMWQKEFDCNMYIYDVPNNHLRVFDRKVSFLGDMMKLRGNVLMHSQPEDPDLLVYSVLTPEKQMKIYVSNKSRVENKNVSLDLVGNQWSPVVAVKRMAVGTNGYVVDQSVRIDKGRLDITVKPLNVLKLVVCPMNSFL